VKRKLTIKARADLDVAGHYVYLLERNPHAADRLRQAVKSAYGRIRHDPRSCARIPLGEFDERELRFCRPSGFDNYLVVFQVTDDTVFVLRVLHASQDLDTALRP
jgi:plasmid stabilization system protein ParE